MILGPTAVGKTGHALGLAEEYNFEIISCDSRQIYRYMDIGTAKPSKPELKRVRHWLIDSIDPDESYSAYQFSKDAAAIIRANRQAKKGALICGGTGLYFRSLSEGLGPQAASNPQIRAQLEAKAREKGVHELHRELTTLDPESGHRIHPNDLQRIIRALAVFYQTGTPISELRNQTAPPMDMQFAVAILMLPRTVLYERINKRVDTMVNEGLWDEFKQLRAKGYELNHPGMLCVGYRELFGVETGEKSFSDACEEIKRNTRRYAKRQITWFANQIKGGVLFDSQREHTKLRDYIAAHSNI